MKMHYNLYKNLINSVIRQAYSFQLIQTFYSILKEHIFKFLKFSRIVLCRYNFFYLNKKDHFITVIIFVYMYLNHELLVYELFNFILYILRSKQDNSLQYYNRLLKIWGYNDLKIIALNINILAFYVFKNVPILISIRPNITISVL